MEVATDDSAYDVVVVGSGFGGSVAALRLTEKGYRVLVVEAGSRFSERDFPRTSWRVRRYLFAPRLGLRGVQRLHVLDDVTILAGAGVGGGSLVYANTLYEPPAAFFDDPQWADITDWHAELAPYYDQARRMLGVVDNPTTTPADRALRRVAEEMGVGSTFRLTPVGVFFGARPGETAADPYFGGAGPARAGCTQCGSCMTGCRVGAKNTLVKNYLGLAESAGASVLADTEVVAIRPTPDGAGRWTVDVERSGTWVGRGRRAIAADHVVVAAGAYNSQKLLHRMRDIGHLPLLSPTLGRLSRTNSEALGGSFTRDSPVDHSRGVAITSSFHPAPDTHVEVVRFGRGSNLMYMLGSHQTEPVAGEPRWRTWMKVAAARPRDTLRYLLPRKASENTVITLVMQAVDNSVTVRSARSRLGRWKLTSTQGHGAPNPTWIPVGNEAVRRLAAVLGGVPSGNLGEVVDRPMTAHFIGGCVIGETPSRGVVDPWLRVHDYDGLHVVDGSTVSANLGVNPSLTITAQAERAMAHWPNRGDPDPRPPLGSAYEPVCVVPPQRPVVPDDAPGALRLPTQTKIKKLPDPASSL